ncbi:pyridoxamine 5'-phosphate oxidase family protein [bacterium]|nr:MAG: pyridoxamine 5'-phosphate oxidase family protein [bacterium]
MNNSIEKLLARSKYMTLATVSKDGKPWNVPITFVYADGLLYWRSHVESTHSVNIEFNAAVSISIFDVNPVDDVQERQALYVQSNASKVSSDRQKELLEKFGDIFSIKDVQAPLYVAEVGILDMTRSTDNRFYTTGSETAGEKQ